MKKTNIKKKTIETGACGALWQARPPCYTPLRHGCAARSARGARRAAHNAIVHVACNLAVIRVLPGPRPKHRSSLWSCLVRVASSYILVLPSLVFLSLSCLCWRVWRPRAGGYAVRRGRGRWRMAGGPSVQSAAPWPLQARVRGGRWARCGARVAAAMLPG